MLDDMTERRARTTSRLARRLARWNLVLAAALFSLQLVHLGWLTTDVVGPRLLGGTEPFAASPTARLLLVLVDYTEIPALVFTSFVYLRSFAATRRPTDLLFFTFVNLQWLHLFWITEAFVVRTFTGTAGAPLLPTAVAWFAIVIDYLEVPVIFETLRRAFASRPTVSP